MKNLTNKDLLTYLAKDRISEVLEFLLEQSISTGEHIEIITLLSARNSYIENQLNEGIISIEDVHREKSKLITDLIQFIQVGEQPSDVQLSEGNNSFVTIKRGSDIKPIDILKNRGRVDQGFKEFYYPRVEVDNQLLNYVGVRKNVLITGRPLGGKSRALYELIIKRLTETDIIIPFKTININKETVEYYQAIKNQSFVLFDDIDEYLEDINYKVIIEAIVSNRSLQILATCRSYKIKSTQRILDGLIERFSIIKIPPITPTEKDLLKREFNKHQSFKSDSTIGSFLLPIHSMENLYEVSLNTVEQEILRSYKVLKYWKKRNFGKLDQIKKYVDKRLEHYYKKNILSENEWDKAILNLRIYGFILLRENYLEVEEIYLDRFIDSYGNRNKYIEEITLYFKDIKTYTQLINKASNYEEASSLLALMEERGIKPNEITFNSLINKASNYEEASSLLALMEERGIKPNEITFTSLINKASNYEEASSLLALMEERGIKPDRITFSSFFKVALRSGKNIALLLKESLKHESYQVQHYYSNLMNCANSFTERLEMLNFIIKNKLPYGISTFHSALSQCSNKDEIEEILTLMESEKIEANQRTTNILKDKKYSA
jgi:pentatricopeptide repeat protein